MKRFRLLHHLRCCRTPWGTTCLLTKTTCRNTPFPVESALSIFSPLGSRASLGPVLEPFSATVSCTLAIGTLGAARELVRQVTRAHAAVGSRPGNEQNESGERQRLMMPAYASLAAALLAVLQNFQSRGQHNPPPDSSPRDLHMEVRNVLCLPRNLHFKKQVKTLTTMGRFRSMIRA